MSTYSNYSAKMDWNMESIKAAANKMKTYQ